MKNLKILSLISCLFVASVTWSQVIEITPSYGYQFGTKLNYGPNYIQIEDSDQFGLNLAFEVNSGLMAEVTYMHHSTQLNIRDVIISPIENRLADLSADWVMVGATKYFKDGKIKPFAGAGMGLTFLSAKNENQNIINGGLSNQTKFAFSFKTGANFMFNDVVGLNLQFNLLLPIDWGGVYVGGGPGGVTGGVSTGSSTIVAGFSGGLVFRLGS